MAFLFAGRGVAMPRSRGFISFLLLAAASFDGCGCFVPVTEQECDTQLLCGADWRCLDGVCHPPDGRDGGAGDGGCRELAGQCRPGSGLNRCGAGGRTCDGDAGFLGCYADQAVDWTSPTAGRDLNGLVVYRSNMTTEVCIRTCGEFGFAYAGLQSNVYSAPAYKAELTQQCFCGNTFGSYGSSSNCTAPCAGNSSQVCGGAAANSVFSTGATPAARADLCLQRKTSLGCHYDMGNPGGTNGRDLSGLYFSVAQMTNDRCLEVCAAFGFAYAGTQYGQSCFCGNSYGSRGAATNCNVPCPGNPCETCGGAWANSVYATDAG